ncbi:MerR family transcriptional regulator [Acidithiobacillus sp. CV18-2]|uniref:MerR family transcriptional regulator n=1 Tax=Igneacidithiobacillus copahuensis TaxID=2724909 RepID=A0AAE2YMW9_9PROT|nr:MerR family transcriptional regulator [Igneacidithiobacillus copahuensis]MBU2755306.1 MerR family transcriptional regulator [Acidithiobacillus sp. CV18-3]MBU2756026.1 MerR family transcriptional regulator [Acidithiobacillus sp. BN09-2]MBU2778237.1 MerR family transcriptional regulator [Acidithiobacillus sp. CV18-2]MBU2796860.1 MerR family transcriptional regulator [Acidithiobacillus sp. VAN18-2]MBU2799110.1 MerR family transcriptional regulator [Acidithiobacillus sp. VAN18-4]
MKIGEIAQRIGVSVSTIRLYESRGLIQPKRSESGTRHYDQEDLARFQAISDLIQSGTSIEALAQLASIRADSKSGDEAAHRVDEILVVLEAEIKKQVKRLNSALLDIQSARQGLVDCYGCAALPTRKHCDSCSISTQLTVCEVMRVVWDQVP